MTRPVGGLVGAGIVLRSENPGEHRAACPECTRTKVRRGDDALAVRIEPDGSAVWICHRCLWSGSTRSAARSDPGFRQWRAPAAAPASPAAPEPHHNQERAQRIWRESQDITDELPLAYLREVRGITQWDPDRLRWHPACPWPGGERGCIIAPVTCHATGYCIAIWRIWPSLTERMDERRRGLGAVAGNAARLWPAWDHVGISEGIEDSLAAAELTGWPFWSATSASNLDAVILPPRIARVLVIQDNDKPDLRTGARSGPDAAQRLAHRLRGEGREVELLAPIGTKDANDTLRRQRRGAA